MASASSSSPFFGGIRDEELQKQTKKQQQQQQQQSSCPERKRRNQPGNPSKYLKHSHMQNMQEKELILAYLPSLSADPDAEVIALSPTTLMATNRFICEVCNKGFQREQNLQLHRRGHNLPWKLRQKSSKEVRRRVYLCPEPTCVHHQPSRALGDLTGIKKHFCRKHGEKKWKCDKCSKRYAVQSDLKAHAKTCGTREYRCDCGTLFSRRDSFITHRAFCDALAQESSRPPTVGLHALGNHLYGNATAMASGLSSGTSSIGNGNSGGNQNNRMLMADGFNSANGSTEPATLFSGNLMIDHVVGGTNSLYNTSMQSDWMLPQMSATALLQKAAQMGVTTSGGPSLLRGFARSSSSRCSFSGDGGDGGGGLQAQTENEAHLQNLMMTLANGGTDLFVGAGGRTTKFDPSGARNLGGSDQLTRDFLGVGSMVRSISSGVTRREPI
ncbi:zinc finger protein [Musa troglodytarum]|uniref:Protein EARLY HEADING DATE 2 n=1 Tax=Musa troglodytarum TaxID=320322 RepID=A0A9E7JI04_9LILI|nr:zinc finger protein [Musa troglodytarum]